MPKLSKYLQEQQKDAFKQFKQGSEPVHHDSGPSAKLVGAKPDLIAGPSQPKQQVKANLLENIF